MTTIVGQTQAADTQALTTPAKIDQQSLQLATDVVQTFGAYLANNDFSQPMRGYPNGHREIRALITKLQEPEVLTNNSLPANLKEAVQQLDPGQPDRDLSLIRNALIHASTFSGVSYKIAGQAQASDIQALTTPATMDQQSLQLITDVVQTFGAYLANNDFSQPMRGYPNGHQETKALIIKLQKPEVLTNNSLPANLKEAVQQLDPGQPDRDLSLIRNALAHASVFSGVSYKG